MYRHILIRLIQALLVLGLAMFAYIYFSGFASNPSSNNRPDPASQLALQIAKGETQFIKLNGERHWVSHLSEEQQQRLKSLESLVQPTPENNLTSCKIDTQLCAIKMATDKAGIEIRYSETAPAFLSPDVPWYGGFVNPSNQAVYDLIGRGYLINQASSENLLRSKAQ